MADMKLKLTVVCEYNSNSVDKETLTGFLHNIVDRAAEHGGFTMETDAEVEVWESTVSEISQQGVMQVLRGGLVIQVLTKEQKKYRKKLDATLDHYLIYSERGPCRYEEIISGREASERPFFFAAVRPCLRGALLGLVEDSEQEDE